MQMVDSTTVSICSIYTIKTNNYRYHTHSLDSCSSFLHAHDSQAWSPDYMQICL